MPHSTDDLAARYRELRAEAGNELNIKGETERYEALQSDADQLYEFVPEAEQVKFVQQIYQR